MEIYNLVFMEYDLQPGNVLAQLPNQNVDTGLGLERTACVLQGVDSVFDTDGFRLIMDWVAAESGVAYEESEISRRAHRVLADHGRAVTLPDRRGNRAVERGSGLHLPPPAAAGDLPGAAHRARRAAPSARAS